MGTKVPKGKFCPFCILSLNPTLTQTPTPTLNLVLHLPLPIALNLIKTEYWDRAGGGGNIGYDW